MANGINGYRLARANALNWHPPECPE